MKKILLILLALTAVAFATGGHDHGPEEPCITCPAGPQGEPGVDGVNGVDGQDGRDGIDGATGPTGATGAQGEQGLSGTNGVDGKNGTDGANGVVDYSYMDEYGERMSEANAGAMAVGAIDFGSVCTGETAVGLGAGVGDWGQERSYAVGAGIKHGITDDTAGVLKGYYGTGGNASGLGVAVVHKF